MVMQLQTGAVDFVCTDLPTATAAAANDSDLIVLNFAGTDGDFQFASEAERAENVNIGMSVAKGSTVTVEAQYRDATIESEPSILGTAAIIGVAGAGTAVIVWQGYRIGMELYEKYFQPTPEEDAVVEPTLESQMTDPIS